MVGPLSFRYGRHYSALNSYDLFDLLLPASVVGASSSRYPFLLINLWPLVPWHSTTKEMLTVHPFPSLSLLISG